MWMWVDRVLEDILWGLVMLCWILEGRWLLM